MLLGLREVTTLHHAAITVCLFYRIKVGTLNIFHKSKLERLIVVRILNAYRHGFQSYDFTCLPTTFARDDLIFIGSNGTNENRLQQTILLD